MVGLRCFFWVGALPLAFAGLPRPLSAAILQSGNVEPDANLWNPGTISYIGNTTDGSVLVDGGTLLESGQSHLGFNTGTTGNTKITGESSSWTNSNLHVGGWGVGSLTIEAGGKVDSTFSTLGVNSGSKGTAVVSGVGSQWMSSDSLTVGNRGSGTIRVEAGGNLRNGWTSTLGAYPGSTGTVTIVGTGSRWITAVYVGWEGSGTLQVEAGGQVFGTFGHLGVNSGSTGKATVTGPGSLWRNTNSLYVGSSGNGLLTVSNGALVTVKGSLNIDNNLDNDSFVNLATGGMLALRGNGGDSLNQFLDLAYGTDAIRYWDTSLADWSLLTNATYGDDYTLEYLTTGDLAGYTLLTVGRVGDFDNDGDVDGRDFLAWQRHPHLGSLADWQNAYGSDSLSATAVVPEPSCSALLLGFMLLSGRVRGPRISVHL